MLTPEEQAPVLERVASIFAVHEQNGRVELPYLTECFRAVRR